MNLDSMSFRTFAATFALVAASIVNPLTAQAGGPPTSDPNYVPGYSITYGEPCGSTFAGPVVLAMTDLPDIGKTITYELSNGVAGNQAWLLLGLAPLNVDLTPIGAWGCHLYVDAVAVMPELLSAVGTAKFDFSIPNNPAVIGMHLFAQGAAADVMANAFGFVFTNGIESSIGGTP